MRTLPSAVTIWQDNKLSMDAVFANEPADTTAERKTSNAGLRNDTRRNGEPKRVSLPVEITQSCTALHTDGAFGWVYMDGAHTREVDDNAVVTAGAPTNVVAAASDGAEQAVLASEINRCDDVCDA